MRYARLAAPALMQKLGLTPQGKGHAGSPADLESQDGNRDGSPRIRALLPAESSARSSQQSQLRRSLATMAVILGW